MAKQRIQPQRNRDDFPHPVKRLLAERAAFRCSNPGCQQPTSGPSSDPLGAVNIGVASHITAASPGGPRYDPNLTHEERQGADNGIWLCQNHGKLVDNDAHGYPVSLLRSWKSSAEAQARNAIESPNYYTANLIGSATLGILSHQVELYADWAEGETESTLPKKLEELREGNIHEARRWVERTKNNNAVWNTLKPEVKAKILQLEARIILDSSNDLERAKALVAETDTLMTSEDSARIRAYIAFREGKVQTGLEILGASKNADALNLKAALLLNLDRVDEAVNLLGEASQADQSNPETFRLQALAFLLQKEIVQAQAAITRALELKPRWFTVRYTLAVIHYWSALSPAIFPSSFVPWPAPVDWAFIKSTDESRTHLRSAATSFHELLNGSEQPADERKYLEAWYLACLANDSDRQDEAVTFCRMILNQDSTHYPILTWVTVRGFNVSIKKSQKDLEVRLQQNSATMTDALALIECYLAKAQAKKALKVLNQARPLFENKRQLWLHWFAQANITNGTPERALDALDNEPDANERDKTRTMVLSALAYQSKDWKPYLEHLEESFAEKKDPVLLLEICGVRARRGEWEYVADRALDLVKGVRTVEAVRLGSTAAYNTRRFTLCIQLLDANRDLFSQQKLPTDLRHLRIQCQYALGALPQAVTEAESLAREEPTVQNLMSLADIYFGKGDMRRLAAVGQQISQFADLSAEWSLHLAHMLVWEDKQLARRLWRRANEKGIPDEAVSTALDLGFRLGLDNDLRALMQRMQELGKQGQGGIELKQFEELIDFVKNRREYLGELENRYRNAEIPIHMFADQLNSSLAVFYHQIPSANELKNPLYRTPLYARHGSRGLPTEFPADIPKWRLHLDVTAFLTAAHFDILDTVEKTFSPLHIPSNLPRALARMREQLTPYQPSKFAEFEQIVELVNRGALKIANPFTPMGYSAESIQQLGEDWIALYDLALTSNGYLVDFLPLTKQGSTVPASSLPKNTEQSVVNCRAVADALRQQGALSEERYAHALEKLSDQARRVTDHASPSAGAALYLVANIPEVLAAADLLAMMCQQFEVYIESEEFERVKAELVSRRVQEETAGWVDNLMRHITEGIDQDIYQIIPTAWDIEGDAEEISLKNPELDCVLTLLRCELQPGDCLWIDDRFSNRYLHRDGIPIVGINEILKILVNTKAVTPQRYYQILHSERTSNVRFVPIQEDEILYHLNQANVENGRLTETIELAALRQSAATCVLSGDLIKAQPHPAETPTPLGEIEFLIQLERAIISSLPKIWEEDADDATLHARADWILFNLYLDHLGIFHAASFERSEQDSRYLSAITLAGLISQGIILDWRSELGKSSKCQRYMTWLDQRILARRFENEPTIITTVAETLKHIFLNRSEEFQDPKTAQVAAFIMQKHYETLPKPIRDELSKDSHFMAEIGMGSVIAVTVGDLNFEADQFYRAATRALNNEESGVSPLPFETTIILRPSADASERNVLYAEHPNDQKEIRIVSDEFILLRESMAERETILNQHPEWFDCSQETRERAIAEIATTQDPVERIRKLNTWRNASAAMFYAETERKLRAREIIEIEEFLPPSSEGLVRHFKLNPNVGPGDAFRDGLEVAAKTLILEEGLSAAIERLIRFPTALPDCLVMAATQLASNEKRVLLEQLLRRVRTPLAKLHLIRLCVCAMSDVTGAERLARRIANNLLTDQESECFDAFVALSHWVHSEFEHRAEFKAWTPQARLAMSWAHTEKLFSLLSRRNISGDWIKETFSNHERLIPPSLFGSERADAHDIAHPRHLGRVSFLLMGLSYALDKKAETIITPEMQARCVQLAFPEQELVRLPDISLSLDATRASNMLNSFLGENRGERLFMLLGEQLSQELSSEVAEELIGRVITEATSENQLVTCIMDP